MPRPQPIITSTEGGSGSKRTLSMALIRYDRFCAVEIRDFAARYPATMQLTRSEANRAGHALLDFAAAMPVEQEV